MTLGKCTQWPNHILGQQSVCGSSSSHYRLVPVRYVDTYICHVSFVICSMVWYKKHWLQGLELSSRGGYTADGFAHATWPCSGSVSSSEIGVNSTCMAYLTSLLGRSNDMYGSVLCKLWKLSFCLLQVFPPIPSFRPTSDMFWKSFWKLGASPDLSVIS